MTVAVAAAAARMTASEVTQALYRNESAVSEQDYLHIIAGKTASLTSCACRIGAMVAAPRSADSLGRTG